MYSTAVKGKAYTEKTDFTVTLTPIFCLYMSLVLLYIRAWKSERKTAECFNVYSYNIRSLNSFQASYINELVQK